LLKVRFYQMIVFSGTCLDDLITPKTAMPIATVSKSRRGVLLPIISLLLFGQKAAFSVALAAPLEQKVSEMD